MLRPRGEHLPDRPGLRIEGGVHRARQAFLEVLDEYDLGQFLKQRSELAPLLEGSLQRRTEAVDTGKG